MVEFTSQSISEPSLKRLEQVLELWVGTPYRAGQQMPGVACDCRSFVLAVLDSLYGKQTDVELLPEDASLHQPEVSRSFLRKMARYWNVQKVEDRVLEPGDLIISAYPGAGPTHVMISGRWPWIYHATKTSGVRKTGFTLDGLEFYGHYRLPHKESWALPHLS